MPWKVQQAVEQRIQLFREIDDGESIAELGRKYGVSRQAIYKWLKRREEGGDLADRSRAPRRHPQQFAEQIREAVLELRGAHPRWGPRTLRAYLLDHRPEQHWPSASTLAEWIEQAGLAHRRRKRRRTPPMETPLSHANAPNQVWCADFKGWFRTGDGARIDPLTMTDAATRFLLRLVAVEKTDGARVRAVMEAAFRQYGLPEAIRTDNGAPFASAAPAGLSRLALWWIRLGIRHERIEPGQPQQNGRHERFHLTLKLETASPPRESRAAQVRAFADFQRVYNQLRPHQALDYRTPDSCYVASTRAFPSRDPEPQYPSCAVLRRVTEKGDIKWRDQRIFISEVFGHQAVGLVRVADRYWEMYYGPVRFGWLDGRACRFFPLHKRPKDLDPDEG